MPVRKLVLLGVALLIALGTVVLARSSMKPPVAADGTAQVAAPAPTTEVLVAARDLPSGTLLKDTDMKWQVWPADGATTGFAVKGAAVVTDYAGAVVRQGLRTGEPLLTGRVVKRHEQGFMASVLNPGTRAVTVSITPVGGVAGFVFPGDRVDVIITHPVTRQTETSGVPRKVSETILTNVRVLALDQRSDDQATEPKLAQTATLEVTPKQAEKVALIADLGTLSLSLRSIANDSSEPPALDGAALVEETGMTWDSDVSKVLPRPGNRQGNVQRVQIMRGKDTTETVFDLWQ